MQRYCTGTDHDDHHHQEKADDGTDHDDDRHQEKTDDYDDD